MIEYAVGIDPGFADCGFSLLRRQDNLQWESLYASVAHSSPKASFDERMRGVYEELHRVLMSLRGKTFLQGIPTVVACEVQEHAQEGNRVRGTTNANALRVQQVVGMVRAVCFMLDLMLVEPTPAQVKAVLGKIPRTASKEQVARAVRALVTGCPESMNEHMSDAIATAVAGARLAHQLRVEQKAKKP